MSLIQSVGTVAHRAPQGLSRIFDFDALNLPAVPSVFLIRSPFGSMTTARTSDSSARHTLVPDLMLKAAESTVKVWRRPLRDRLTLPGDEAPGASERHGWHVCRLTINVARFHRPSVADCGCRRCTQVSTVPADGGTPSSIREGQRVKGVAALHSPRLV
jgi:hypothetical protein